MMMPASRGVLAAAVWSLAGLPSAPVHGDADTLGPDDIESRIVGYLGNDGALEVTSIGGVSCDEESCQITFTGTDPNPQFVDQYHDLGGALWPKAAADGLHMLTSSLGTREIAPGAREYVFTFTYTLTEKPATDAEAAARQRAACANAWLARAEQADALDLDEIAEDARQRAHRYLTLAAAVLPRAEAQRLAHLPDAGPLLEECLPARMYVQ